MDGFDDKGRKGVYLLFEKSLLDLNCKFPKSL